MIVGRRSSPVTGLAVAVAIPVLFALGIGLRMALWPAAGLEGDIDQFVLWVHGIAIERLGQRLRPEPRRFPAVDGLDLGRARGARARVPDRDRRLRPRDPGADEGPCEPRRPGHRRRGRLVVPRQAVGRARRRSRPSCCGRSPGTCPRGGASTRRSTCCRRSSRCWRRARAARASWRCFVGDQPDDEAPGAAVPRAVRGLVPCDAGAPRDRSRAAVIGVVTIVAPVAAVRRGERAGELPRQPRRVPERDVRRSSRCARGTRGGPSRRSARAATSCVDSTPVLGPLDVPAGRVRAGGLLSRRRVRRRLPAAAAHGARDWASRR